MVRWLLPGQSGAGGRPQKAALSGQDGANQVPDEEQDRSLPRQQPGLHGSKQPPSLSHQTQLPAPHQEGCIPAGECQWVRITQRWTRPGLPGTLCACTISVGVDGIPAKTFKYKNAALVQRPLVPLTQACCKLRLKPKVNNVHHEHIY